MTPQTRTDWDGILQGARMNAFTTELRFFPISDHLPQKLNFRVLSAHFRFARFSLGL